MREENSRYEARADCLVDDGGLSWGFVSDAFIDIFQYSLALGLSVVDAARGKKVFHEEPAPACGALPGVWCSHYNS